MPAELRGMGMGRDRRSARSPLSHWRLALLGGTALAVFLTTAPAFAIDVFNEIDLNAAIETARTTANTEIVLKNNIALTADLSALQGTGTVIRSDTGQNYVIDGAGTYRGLFVYSGTARIENLTIQNAVAQGGKGGDAGGFAGGGGAGLGGALFVNAGAAATIANVSLNGNSGLGGSGGVAAGAGGAGGGGGMGGYGGSGGGTGGGGGGGIGVSANGGANAGATTGSTGIVTGGASGGGALGTFAGAGGANGGGGGGGAYSGGGGGVGGSNGAIDPFGGSGGGGGFGGGGGGYGATGGGFGGGGGGGHENGTAGGFGGGGGSSGSGGGLGGFGGGNGIAPGIGGAGGGGGMGGAIFVVDGGSLTVEGNFTVNGNSVAGGAAGGAGATAGSAYGSGLFLQGSGTLTFTPGAGNTQTISDNIADQTGSGGTGTYATGGPTCTAGVGCGSYSGAGSWALTKAGAGTLVLSGANTYTGGTTIAGGTLRVENNAALGTGTVRTTGSVLDYANGITLNNPIVIDSNTTQLQVLAGSATQAGAISELNGPRPLEKIGAGTLTLATPATYTGTTMVRAGTLQAGGANVFATGSAHNVASGATLDLNGFNQTVGSLTGAGTVKLGAGTLTVGGDNTSQGFSGSITGSGGLTKTGTGALILLGASSYSGGTTVSQGSVHALVTGALGTGPITIGTANLAFLNASAGQLAISLANSDSNLYFLTAASAHDATIDSNGTVTFANDADAAHARIANSHMVIFDDSATASNAVITNRANGLTGFFGNNTADQATVVNNAGGRVDISGLSTSGIGIGSLSGNGAVYLGAKTLVLGGLGMNETIGGVIRNGGEFGGAGGGLVKTGAGNLVLAGLNTYTGTTTVDAGTLSVNGSIASSSMTTVNPGGTLGGNGTVGNTLINGGTLAPGNSIGGLTVAGNLVMTAASTYMVEVSPAGSDFTHVTGTATLGGATVQAQFAAGSYVEKRYTILTADGGVSGTFSGPVNTNLPQNFKSALAADGNNAYLDLKLNFVVPSGLNVNQHNVANTLVNSFNSNGGIPLAFGALDPRGLSQASGEIGTTASQAAFDAQSQFLNTLTDPLAGGQAAATSSSPSQPMAYAGERKPHDAFASLVTKAPPMQTFAQRWRVFGAAYGGNTQIGGNAALGSHDATSRVYGAMGGASYALSPATELGFAFGGGGTSFALAGGMGSGRSDMFQAGVFAHHGFARNGYLSGAFAYGWHDVSTDRTVATGERLHGAYKAGVLSGRLEAGWRIDTAWAGVTPYAAAQAISYRMPSYLEQGNGMADSFALGYAGRDVTATRSELGLRLDRTTVMGDTLLTLRGRAAWAHNFDTARNAAATFQALPGSGFLVNGAAMAPDAALVTAGAEIAWRNGFALAASFEGEFSNNVTSYTGKGTLKYAW